MIPRKCCICGARVSNQNPSPKIDTCDHVCREAKAHGISRAEQLQREADSIPWPENPFELLANGIARRSYTLTIAP
mgnify:CR=1 FL=1